MKLRMQYDGGDSDGRNVKGKLNSLKSALQNSYQAEWITIDNKKCRCLINPDKLKEDYDQKEISIEFEYGLKEGMIFYWDRTKTHWIVFLQRLEEEAYFRAQIRRCDYQLNGYWIYLRGPVETALIWRQKHSIEFNDLNYSIMFYIEKNEETLTMFSRFNIIKFDGHNWRVATTDKYSQPGIIQVFLEEYFDNKMEENKSPLVIEEQDTTKPYIDGPRIARGYATDLCYTIMDLDGGEFIVDSKKVIIKKKDSKTCIINLNTGKAFCFNVTYRLEGHEDIILPVKVESL